MEKIQGDNGLLGYLRPLTLRWVQSGTGGPFSQTRHLTLGCILGSGRR